MRLRVHALCFLSTSNTQCQSGEYSPHARCAHPWICAREVGVPFRRYRGWHRLRVAIREVTRGATFTAAAHGAGFADQSHFNRAFRATIARPLMAQRCDLLP